jgi:ribosomal protein S11
MNETIKHTEELRNIQMWMNTGAISYDSAKKMAATHLEAMNNKAREIAKRHGIKPRLITFASFMR